jgi:hypothetical protein
LRNYKQAFFLLVLSCELCHPRQQIPRLRFLHQIEMDLGIASFPYSKLEKSSDEVEDVKDDRPIGPASERSTFWPRI